MFDAATVVWAGELVARAARGAVSLAVELAGLALKNPLIAASGTFGYGVEYEGLLDLSTLGGLVSKGLYLEPRDGCPTPRIVETPSGLLNAIGLQGVGVRAFVRDVLPRLARYDTAVLVNVCGDTRRGVRGGHAHPGRTRRGVAGLEINISCPNVKTGRHGVRRRSADDARGRVRGAQATRLPVIPKLSPNVARHHGLRARLRRRRAPTRSPASTRCSAWRSTSRRAGRGWPSAPAGSPAPPSARSRCAWPGRRRAR